MIILPNRETKILRQVNRGNILGELWSSFNLDLQSNLGAIRVSPRLSINTAGASNQGRMVAARTFDQRIFAICGTRVFKNSAYNFVSSFAEDASTGAVTDYDPLGSDMENFNSTLVVTSDGAVLSKAANGSGTGAWTSRATLSVTSNGIHKLCYFQRHNRVYYLDGDNVIKSMDTSWSEATSGDYYLSLSSNYGIFNTMATDIDNIWIGTIHSNPTSTLRGMTGASILRWDGQTSAVFEYKIKAQGVQALCKDDSGVMHAIDSNGSLLRFDGGAFTEIARLPLDKKLLKNAADYGYNSFVHPNGFTYSRNGTFLVLVNNLNGDNGGTINENLPSGIWEYHPDTGFVHRQSASYNAVGGDVNQDFGQNRVADVGALYAPDIYSTSATGKPTLIAGINYYSDASTEVSGIFVDEPLDDVQKYGYFVTTWLTSQGIKDTWARIWTKHRQLLDSGDKIIIKSRVREVAPTEISITWVNTTSFTTATDLTGYEGYEVEVIQGDGSGKCSHITTIAYDDQAELYTITVDETYVGITTNTAKARVQDWKKLGSVTGQSDESYSMNIDETSERIQLKVCMQFTGEDEVHEIAVVNKQDQPIE